MPGHDAFDPARRSALVTEIHRRANYHAGGLCHPGFHLYGWFSSFDARWQQEVGQAVFAYTGL
jgi:hypothetical protein